MKRLYFVTLALILMLMQTSAQTQQSELEMLQKERQEYYFMLKFKDVKELAAIAEMVWLDEVDGNSCIAYANPQQFENLKKAGYKPELLIPPSLLITDQPMSGPEELRQKKQLEYLSHLSGLCCHDAGFSDQSSQLVQHS